MWSTRDLIVAPATPPGSGGRAVVRMSGEGLGTLLSRLFRSAAGFGVDGEGSPRRIRATLGSPGLADEWGEVGIEILHWPGPQGPTGGPVAEVQLPASTLLADAVVGEACRHGARPARGGEFSLRAFLSGRLDLLQAEAVLAVVDARTPTELSAALDALAGGVGRRLHSLRDTLLDLAADVEATIDFADEATPDTVPVRDEAVRAAVRRRVAEAVVLIEDVAARLGARDASTAEDLPRVVLAGPPNIGKSSLFNRLVGRDAALVADEPGTTRDWIAARLDAHPDEPPCLLVDSAGIAPDEGTPGDELARAAADRARSEIARAAVLIACRDARAGRETIPHTPSASFPAPRVDVLTRCDLDDTRTHPAGTILTSSRSGAGIRELRELILTLVVDLPNGRVSPTARMRVGLSAARTALVAAAATWDDAVDASSPAADEAVMAALIRRAITAIDDATGAEIGTDLIERIFARHCIGK